MFVVAVCCFSRPPLPPHTPHRATASSPNTIVPIPLHDVNATDEIISSTARHIHATDGSYDAMANKTIHEYTISVNGTEEQFFLRYVACCFSSSVCLLLWYMCTRFNFHHHDTECKM